MLKELVLYIEVDDLAIDEGTGEPCTAAVCVKVGRYREDKYDEIMKAITTHDGLLKFICAIGLGDVLEGKEFRLITKEQYDERYGEEE